jgi:hypothetical protein
MLLTSEIASDKLVSSEIGRFMQNAVGRLACFVLLEAAADAYDARHVLGMQIGPIMPDDS